jgi:hypothetical protein
VSDLSKAINYFLQGKSDKQREDICRCLGEKFIDSVFELIAEMQAPSVLLDRSALKAWKNDYLEGLNGISGDIPLEIIQKIFCIEGGAGVKQ